MGRLYASMLSTHLPSARLAAVLDADPAIQASMESEFGVPHVADDAASLFARSDIAAVLITTPTSTHARLVIAAAEAGKAIFCEKPLALSVEESRAAVAAVKRAGVPLQVGFMRRFDAAYVRAKSQIDAGQIGYPTIFKSVGRDPFCPRVDFADPARSGGLIVDMGIHDFDLARWLTNSEVTSVSAEGSLLVCQELAAVGDIDNAVVNLRFASGAVGNVDLTRNAFYGYDIRTEVLGSEGALLIGDYKHTPVVLLTRAGAQHDVTPYLMERFGPAYRAQIEHFVACVRAGTLPAVSGEDALAAFAIARAATLARERGQTVDIQEVLMASGAA
jgi:scyllo-inositol 2-dehydrogenase (NAD+)